MHISPLDAKIQSWAHYRNIVVVGPCRSGSTFFSQYIGEKLRCFTIDERVHRYSDPVFKFLLNMNIRKVIQCPGYLCTSHLFSGPDTLYVVMIRDINDIIRSSKRINDQVSHHGFNRLYERYEKYIGEDPIKKYKPKILDFGASAKFRYAVWENHQKKLTKNFVEINYQDLACADSYILAERRTMFTEKQTRENDSSETFFVKAANKASNLLLLVLARLFGYSN